MKHLISLSLSSPWTLVLLGSVACSGESLTTGLEEPIRVHEAQFREGTLPGKRPLTTDEIVAGQPATKPTPTSVETARRVLAWSESRLAVSGRTSTDAASIAIGFPDLGTGYWVLPVSAPDPVNNGELSWRFTADLGTSLPPGLHHLRIAAIDTANRSGTQGELELCVKSPIPDNLNACIPTERPPESVVSLAWNANVDLDLHIVTPDGKVLDAKHPSTALADDEGVVDPTASHIGLLQQDVNPECSGTGNFRENVVWADKPQPGRYLIYANLYDACGEPSVSFDVSAHVASAGSEPGTFAQVQVLRTAAVLLAAQANGGGGRGTFIDEFVVR